MKTSFTLLLALALAANIARAESIQASSTYHDFSSTSGLILQGFAAPLDGRLRLTPAKAGQGTGGAWLETRQPVKDGFETMFQIQITDKKDHGADGLAFAIQNSPAPRLGFAGCNLGFGGLSNLLVVKFKNYHGDNPQNISYDEIAVMAANSPTNALWDCGAPSLASVTNHVVFSDGQIHVARLVYVPGNLQVYLDDMENPLMTVYINLAKVMDLDEGRAWVGFTAGCGDDWQNQDLLSWSFSGTGVSPVRIETDGRDACATIAETIQVPATANPWLAGMPDGSSARRGDTAPGESPVAVTNTAIQGGAVYLFSASGSANHGATLPFFPPDGESYIASHYLGAENGIADIKTPYTSLMGVFLGPEQPDESPAPQPLDFTTLAQRDCQELAPALKQPFFIGSGLTSSGAAKQVIAPAGATRLLLGIMDEYEWSNNQGSFAVQVTKLESTSAVRPQSQPSANSGDANATAIPLFSAPLPVTQGTKPLVSDPSFGYALPNDIGVGVQIEASTDLVHWESLTNASFYFRDADSSNYPTRFYRFSR